MNSPQWITKYWSDNLKSRRNITLLLQVLKPSRGALVWIDCFLIASLIQKVIHFIIYNLIFSILFLQTQKDLCWVPLAIISLLVIRIILIPILCRGLLETDLCLMGSVPIVRTTLVSLHDIVD